MTRGKKSQEQYHNEKAREDMAGIKLYTFRAGLNRRRTGILRQSAPRGEALRISFGDLMKVPGAEHAVVDIRKLRDYCLNSTHELGRHKARLFAATLGMTADDAQELHSILLEAVRTHDAQLGLRDKYGQRYNVDFELVWHGRRATVRTAWIIEHNSDAPRLTSCFPLTNVGGEST